MEDIMLNTWGARIGAVSGLLSVVLGVAATFVVPQPPQLNDALQTINAYLASHHTGVQVSQLLATLGSLFTLAFVVYLWSVLRQAEGDAGAVSALALAGGAGSVVISWVQSGVILMLAAMATQNTDGGFRGLYDLAQMLGYFVIFAVVVFLGAAAAVVLSTHVLPAWLGWSAALLAVALLVAASASIFDSAVAQGPIGLVLFLLFLLWVAATSLVLTRRAWYGKRPKTSGTAAASV
jgi:hypothetical protein